MSLFDVIKYPISNPPTAKQLEALPPKLFRQWKGKVNWWHSATAPVISSAYRPLQPRDINDIILLRKMIEEYDESI